MNKKTLFLYLVFTLVPSILAFVSGLQYDTNKTVLAVTLVLLSVIYAVITVDLEAPKK